MYDEHRDEHNVQVMCVPEGVVHAAPHHPHGRHAHAQRDHQHRHARQTRRAYEQPERALNTNVTVMILRLDIMRQFI